MESPSFASVPDWSRGGIWGLQVVVKTETGFKATKPCPVVPDAGRPCLGPARYDKVRETT